MKNNFPDSLTKPSGLKMSPPCKAATVFQQIHKSHADEAIDIQNQVGFLEEKKHINMEVCGSIY